MTDLKIVTLFAWYTCLVGEVSLHRLYTQREAAEEDMRADLMRPWSSIEPVVAALLDDGSAVVLGKLADKVEVIR